MRQSECPECGGRDLFETVEPTSARGSNGPDLLPGLGSLFHPAKVRVVLCGDCGHARFYAETEARKKVREAKKWRRV